MRLIVGLGNPGSKYVRTRHNAGFLLVDLIGRHLDVDLNRKMFDAEYGEGVLLEESVVLIKPQTFMNLSGRSVKRWLSFYKLSPKDLIVIHDDIDLAPTSVKMRNGGGHGGHNGIRSIVEETGQSDFFRIKLGVGKPNFESADKENMVTSWVLGTFTEQELENLETVMYRETMLRLKEIFLQDQRSKPKGDSRA